MFGRAPLVHGHCCFIESMENLAIKGWAVYTSMSGESVTGRALLFHRSVMPSGSKVRKPRGQSYLSLQGQAVGTQ